MLSLWFVTNTLLAPISITIGGLKLGVNVIVLVLIGTVWIGRRLAITRNSAKVLIGILIYLFFSYASAIVLSPNDKFIKSILSAPILLYLILIGFEIGRRAKETDWLKLQIIAIWVLLAAFLSFATERLWPEAFRHDAGYLSQDKYSGIFTEPSHVAYLLFPWIAILLTSHKKKHRQNGLLALIGLLLLSPSSTLIALIAAWIVYDLIIQRKFRQGLLVALGFAFLIALGSNINYDRFVAPTIERISGVVVSSSGKNVSSLVYLQGWQDAFANFRRTHGLGLGFNMMGGKPLPDVPAREVLAIMNLGDLNAEDGSFLFSKVVSETGAMGILFFIIAISWWVRFEKRIRKCNFAVKIQTGKIQAALIFCFIATSFIRSAGYFNGLFFFFIVVLAGSAKWSKYYKQFRTTYMYLHLISNRREAAQTIWVDATKTKLAVDSE